MTNDLNKKATQPSRVEKTRGAWVVLRSARSRAGAAVRGLWTAFVGVGPKAERVWKLLAEWSVVVFVAAVGGAAVGITLLVGGTDGGPNAIFGRFREKSETEAGPAAVQAPLFRSAIDGTPVENEAEKQPRLVGVVIDNHVDALPQAGVAAARLVIEAPAEGGITRLLAFFDLADDVAKIGPVRSARPYFIDWAEEYGAMLAHVGGSPEALEILKTGRVKDLNEFFWGKYFRLDGARTRPHSTYTATELLRQAFAARFAEAAPKNIASWPYAAGEPVAAPASETTVHYGNSLYEVTWIYEPAAAAYTRKVHGAVQKDEDGSVVRPKNVVVQFAQVRVLDDIGRRKIETLGGGRALVMRAGETLEAAWKRDQKSERIRFFDAAGKEIELIAGQTWISVVPVGTDVDRGGDIKNE